MLFGPRRCDGVGLSDGEMMERLWSYMRRYSRMTKEMRPSHRIDVLCSALVVYGLQKKRKFGMCVLLCVFQFDDCGCFVMPVQLL